MSAVDTINHSSDAPNHLNTNIESGEFDEKLRHGSDPEVANKQPYRHDEEEDEDMDALIDELESQDGHQEEEEGEAEATPGGGRVVPEDQLQTDTTIGLTESEVIARRKKYGMNQMKEEKENLILKFLGYFIGPIQFVMEVCYLRSCYFLELLLLRLPFLPFTFIHQQGPPRPASNGTSF
jgi:H+-transporting ATPase